MGRRENQSAMWLDAILVDVFFFALPAKPYRRLHSRRNQTKWSLDSIKHLCFFQFLCVIGGRGAKTKECAHLPIVRRCPFVWEITLKNCPNKKQNEAKTIQMFMTWQFLCQITIAAAAQCSRDRAIPQELRLST